MPGLYFEVIGNGVQNLGGTATTKLARGGGTQLKEVGCDGFPVVHRVEGSDLVCGLSMTSSILGIETHLVNPHLWHIQQLGNSVHHTNARPSLVLPLT